MKKLDMIYEGKAKKVYKTDNENEFIVDYKDDATAMNGLKTVSYTHLSVRNRSFRFP